jgi:tetratricopeptide (TPR) repeat protein
LFLGGALCNLGNVALARGEPARARGLYERAIATIEAVRDRLPGNALVEQFLGNSRDGVQQARQKPALDLGRFQCATLAWSLPGPPAPSFAPDDPHAAALRRADELRLVGREDEALAATLELVQAADSAQAWLLRGLVLGHFLTEQGGASITWHDERHEEATAAFYQVLVRRPDEWRARLYKGLVLRMAAHAAQAHLRAMLSATEKLSEPQRQGYLQPARTRYEWTVRRAAESLEGAARARPSDGRPLYELAVLYHGLGLAEQARPYLERLRNVDAAWWERVRATSRRRTAEADRQTPGWWLGKAAGGNALRAVPWAGPAAERHAQPTAPTTAPRPFPPALPNLLPHWPALSRRKLLAVRRLAA